MKETEGDRKGEKQMKEEERECFFRLGLLPPLRNLETDSTAVIP